MLEGGHITYQMQQLFLVIDLAEIVKHTLLYIEMRHGENIIMVHNLVELGRRHPVYHRDIMGMRV